VVQKTAAPNVRGINYKGKYVRWQRIHYDEASQTNTNLILPRISYDVVLSQRVAANQRGQEIA
jgi:hypothetical protein